MGVDVWMGREECTYEMSRWVGRSRRMGHGSELNGQSIACRRLLQQREQMGLRPSSRRRCAHAHAHACRACMWRLKHACMRLMHACGG
eukprot:363400-Chlamydomonas_euryale.AAC.7